MKKKIRKILRYYLHRNRLKGLRHTYLKQINIRLSNIENLLIDKEGEERFRQKWEKVDPIISSLYYRVYYSLSNNPSIDYVSDYLYYSFIEPQLNNYTLSPYGTEKNYYDKLFNDIKMPKTILRNMNGINMDQNYNQIHLDDQALTAYCSKYEAVFIKPSLDSGQGKNVERFVQSKGVFINGKGDLLSTEFLKTKYGADFIIQESLQQCDLLNQFNKDSINTLRILTYRSVKTNEVIVLHTTLRVGKTGALTDASRTGGRFCGIYEDGRLIEKIYDSKGNTYSDFNGFDIINQDCKIPNFNLVLACAKASAEQIHHHRVLALDIMIDSENMPRLIEVNPVNQGMFIFQATIGPMFKEYTDEVLEYCLENQEKYRSHYELFL